ncbi:MAG: S24 family peptidase [candidate division WOR-3 bacterium]
MEPKERIGNRLRRFRKNKGWTLKELGQMLGVHWTTIQAWEKGKYSVPTTRVFKVCELFGISPNQLFEEKPDELAYPYVEGIFPETAILAPENVVKNINMKEILPVGPDFALFRVESDSMKNLGILKGDWAVVDTSIKEIHIKNIYAVAIFHSHDEKGEITFKKVEKIGGTVILIPSNPEYDIQIYHQSEIAIIGKLVGVVRSLKN